jgi:hypothetical protein
VTDDFDSFERVPPHDAYAEQAALGACLLSPVACAEVLATVAAEAFYRPQHATIYDAIATLFLAGEPVDQITSAASAAQPTCTNWSRPSPPRPTASTTPTSFKTVACAVPSSNSAPDSRRWATAPTGRPLNSSSAPSP